MEKDSFIGIILNNKHEILKLIGHGEFGRVYIVKTNENMLSFITIIIIKFLSFIFNFIVKL